MGGELTGIDLRADEHREVARLLQKRKIIFGKILYSGQCKFLEILMI